MSDTKISEALAWCSTCPNSGRQEVTNNHNTLGAWHRAGRKITSLHPQPAELAEQQEVELPPLPPVDGYDKRVHGHYSAEQMRDYARNAIRSAKQEQACSGLGIDKMAKELLERHTVAVPVAVEDGRCFMVREQDALDAIRAALAATGKQQAGEVQGSREGFESWAQNHGYDVLDLRRDNDGDYDSLSLDRCWTGWQAALAAHQPGAQEELHGFLKNSTPLREAALRALGFIDRSDEHGRTAYDCLRRELHAECAAPPAQGIDLGQFRAAVAMYEWAHRGLATHSEKLRAEHQDAVRLLALIDQRDAAPGVKP